MSSVQKGDTSFSFAWTASLNLRTSSFCLFPLSENVLQYTPVPKMSKASLTCLVKHLWTCAASAMIAYNTGKPESQQSISENVRHVVTKGTCDLFGSWYHFRSALPIPFFLYLCTHTHTHTHTQSLDSLVQMQDRLSRAGEAAKSDWMSPIIGSWCPWRVTVYG